MVCDGIGIAIAGLVQSQHYGMHCYCSFPVLFHADLCSHEAKFSVGADVAGVSPIHRVRCRLFGKFMRVSASGARIYGRWPYNDDHPRRLLDVEQ